MSAMPEGNLVTVTGKVVGAQFGTGKAQRDVKVIRFDIHSYEPRVDGVDLNYDTARGVLTAIGIKSKVVQGLLDTATKAAR